MKTTARKRLRIFISSPGDVESERQKAAMVIDYLQRWYGDAVTLEAVLWEDLPLNVSSSFQEGIDIILNQAPIDIAVFILWNRLGSPLGRTIVNREGQPYRSGTEREFDLMLAAFDASGGRHPKILFYRRLDDSGFSERLDARKHDDDALEQHLLQRRLARAFVEEHFRDDEGHNTRAYHSFEKPVDFAQRLRIHLRTLIDQNIETTSELYETKWTQVPYRGLETFDLEHADIFFGRDEEICQIESLLRGREREQPQPCAFVAVIGASGSGKSSLVRAGLRASLGRNVFDESVTAWRPVVLVPGQMEGSLLEGLLSRISAVEVLPELSENGVTQGDLAEAFAGNPPSATRLCLVPALRRATEKAGGTVKLLLVIDQFEELFTDPRIGEHKREEFLRVVEAFARSGLCWVVVTMRSDFYPLAQKSAAFVAMKGSNGHFDLLPPGPEALRRIITEPARLAGVRFERRTTDGQSLASRIFEDAHHNPDLLPLLSDLLLELYLKRSAEDEITFAVYEDMGGIEGALSKRAEDLYNSLSTAQSALFPEVLQALITVEPRSETVAVRRRASLEALRAPPEKSALVDAFISHRLLTAEGGRNGETPTVSLAHEALIRGWPRVAEWVRLNRYFLSIRSRVEQFQERWNTSGRRSDLLLSEGIDLDEGLSLLHKAPDLVKADEYLPVRDYIAASDSFVKKRASTIAAEREQLLKVRDAIDKKRLPLKVLHMLANSKYDIQKPPASFITRACSFVGSRLFRRKSPSSDSNDFSIKLGGHKTQAVVMFTDIESFADMSQRVRDPERIVDILNGYFERTTSHISEHDGVVIKLIGDAIFAAWGVPVADQEAPIKAVRAAWKLHENARFHFAGDELRTRVGIHFGEVVADNVGSSRHNEYTNPWRRRGPRVPPGRPQQDARYQCAAQRVRAPAPERRTPHAPCWEIPHPGQK